MPDAVAEKPSQPALLHCPLTHAKLHPQGEFLVTDTGIKYPLKDGIPVLLPTAAILPVPTTHPSPLPTPAP